MVDFIISLMSSVRFVIVLSDSCLLDSIVYFMIMNCSSDLLYILLPSFRILKLDL